MMSLQDEDGTNSTNFLLLFCTELIDRIEKQAFEFGFYSFQRWRTEDVGLGEKFQTAFFFNYFYACECSLFFLKCHDKLLREVEILDRKSELSMRNEGLMSPIVPKVN